MHHVVLRLPSAFQRTFWRLRLCVQALLSAFSSHCKPGFCILFQKSKRCSTSHKNALRASFWCDGADRATILPAFRFLEMTWQLVFEKHSSIECFHTFDCFDIQSSFLYFFFFSFGKRWASLSWREVAIDFDLEAKVKGSLARLNVYWPGICHMVCIF